MNPAVRIGDSPLLLAQPHGGVDIPEPIWRRLNAQGQAQADTDWHITRLYDGLSANATIVCTPIHRYVIDVNRDPADQSLYPGQNTTALCPTTTFDGADIYLPGEAPSDDEIAERQRLYHQPYHDALREQLDRIYQRHGFAILYDCHSIRSTVPYLFDGRLPDFNIGSYSGGSCDAAIDALLYSICEADPLYTVVRNGRFKGGWTTRHYGVPSNGFHAVQMELSQCTYMLEQAPWSYDKDRADKLRVILASALEKLTRVFD